MPSSLNKDHPLFALLRACRKRVVLSSGAYPCTICASDLSAFSLARDQGFRRFILEFGTLRIRFSLDW
jgi:hypothetical protein